MTKATSNFADTGSPGQRLELSQAVIEATKSSAINN
jgi:hypothetical protein